MSQDRLNHLLVLNVNKDLTDSLDLISVGNDLTADLEHRLSIDGLPFMGVVNYYVLYFT